MVQERDSRFFYLSAGCWARLCLVLLSLAWLPAAHASRTGSTPSPEHHTILTPSLETRVGGPLPTWSGRLFSEGSLKLEIAPTYEELDYEIVSGRRQWPNRDPIGIEGGINLYAFVGNSPVNRIEPWGLVPVPVSTSIDTARRYEVFLVSPIALAKALGSDYANALMPDYNIVTIDSELVPLFSAPILGQFSYWSEIKGTVHSALDATGVLDPTPISDGLNAVLYAAEGELGYAGISATAMLPWLGDLAKVSKYGVKAQKGLVGVGSYRELSKLTEGSRGELQVHHLVEQRHQRAWNLTTHEIDTSPGFVLTRPQHQDINRLLERRLPNSQGPYTRQEVLEVYRDIYKDFPEWVKAVEDYLK